MGRYVHDIVNEVLENGWSLSPRNIVESVCDSLYYTHRVQVEIEYASNDLLWIIRTDKLSDFRTSKGV